MKSITIKRLKELQQIVISRVKQEGVIDDISICNGFNELFELIKDEGIGESTKINDTRNILEHANDIIFNRCEEKERQYGPMIDSMKDCATIASIMCNKEITTEDFYRCMVALKLARLKYNTKYDTLLDGISYIAGLHDFNIKNSNIDE